MATPPALRSLEYWVFQYKRTWRGSLASSFLNPVLFLAAMGLGLGSIVDHSGQSAARLGGVGYLTFLAPGLMAASAMQTASTEATYPVMGAIKWIRTYHGMLATPIGVDDVMVGHLVWMALRLLSTTTIFLLVMVCFGAVSSPLAVLAVPAAVLTGMAFAAPIAAFAAGQDTDESFAVLFRFVIIPMFLFSGTFFPVSQLPAALRPVAYVTPLWHGVDLTRALALGRVRTGPTVGHVLYLAAWVAAGVAAARRTFRRRLVR